MPPKTAPKCCECQKNDSLLWRTVEQGQICQECYEQKSSAENSKEKEIKNENKITVIMEDRSNKSLRKSTRSTRFKSKATTSSGIVITNSNTSTSTGKSLLSRNRRSLFKKAPFKLPVLQACTRYTDNVFYKGSYMQVGDIVSMVDKKDNVYYAQIRGLLIDAYCEKSAYLTWLIPTTESPDPKEGFDPATYLIGHDEESPRKLCYLEFVMHAPSNYYYDRTQPFPVPDEIDEGHKKGGFIWLHLPGWERHRT